MVDPNHGRRNTLRYSTLRGLARHGEVDLDRPRLAYTRGRPKQPCPGGQQRIETRQQTAGGHAGEQAAGVKVRQAF